MKRLLLLFLFATCALVSADDTAKIYTSVFGKTKALPVSVFDSVKFPISVAELIKEWGPGYRSKSSGTGMIYWRCVDGRFACVGPVSDFKTILKDPKIDYGNAQVSFFDANVGWSPFPLSVNLKEYKEAKQGGAGQPATRFQSKSEGGDKPQPEAEGRSR
jgi:hypothetical protein